MRRFFTWSMVILTIVPLSAATAPAGVITTAPGTFISVELADTYGNQFGHSGGIINVADVPGSVVFGGGVGSGIGESFGSNSADANGHTSFTTAAYQDFGIFGGLAAIDFGENRINAGPQSWRIEAFGVSQEQWTITGGVGQGFLHLGWLVSGSTLSMASFDGTSDAHMQIDVQTSYFPRLNDFVSNIGEAGASMHVGGFYPALNIDGQKGLPFIFGVPLTIKTTSLVQALTDGINVFEGGATADFSHTETLSHVGVTDLFGNPISDFHITASSGTQYDANGVHFSETDGAVPEPSSIILWGIGGLFLTIGSLRRRRWSRVM